MNLGSYLTRSSSFWPDREALVCGGRRWTYRELEARTNRLASALLARGIRPGQAVATFAGNCAELVETEMALCKGGFLRVPINTRLAAGEVEHVLADASVRVLFTDAANAGAAREIVDGAGLACEVVDYGGDYADLLAAGAEDPVAVEVAEDDPAVLNFTSGSTGTLKAAVQTTGNRLANMRKRLMTPERRPEAAERYLAAGPITHATGMGLLAAFARGTSVVVQPRWDAGEFLRLVEAERITSTFLVPTMLNLVLSHPDLSTADLSSMTCLRVGGAPVSPQRLREAVAAFGPVVMQGYGQVETTSGVTVLTAEDVARGIAEDPELLSSCGRPVYDTEVRVVDDGGDPVPAGELGEVVVRGPDCVREYWGEPELSAQTFRDGWVHTGDIGYLRADGYLFIVDRKKDMIISGGFNVYCSEVEAALYEHPAVSEACVVGVPDETWGEAVKAVVVTREAVPEAGLIEFCATKLARHKLPKTVDFAAALPVNRNGKIDRRAVRDRYWTGSDRKVH
ncbi:Acyl-CoA synthetase (AMP-forming)/AMP-acid ligase II [Saccharopolyspora kobensis]|uniref:Acyl-CoA synthetase (AMP-forming)/AMP-acid ligase II n=2 Tax=Saccharopolyspora kobensis TaxID=146035 RepID=A0A1H5ZQ06_9PSEU|nr:Acyl-CoA synthetase (AMP-forming)/AMP-acid ligase II [Saccharopolyspora kobensis]SFF22141.1 Acyl-CoA synthetase (AMP-forming)/AMP-acid ligase II [Saccharopolyspora kobensis]